MQKCLYLLLTNSGKKHKANMTTSEEKRRHISQTRAPESLPDCLADWPSDFSMKDMWAPVHFVLEYLYLLTLA